MVKASMRSKAAVLYLTKTRDIEVWLMRKQERTAKKHRYFFQHYLIKYAADAFAYAERANRIHITDYEVTYVERTRLLNMAIVSLYQLDTQIEALYHCYKHEVFSNAEMEQIAGLVYEAIKLIKGVLRNDKARLKNLGMD